MFRTESHPSPGTTYYKTIADVRAMHGNAVGTRLRVGADIQRGSIQRNGKRVSFMLVQDDLKMQVVYDGSDPLPETFRDSAIVLVVGKLGRDDVFHASEILVSNVKPYVPPEPQDLISAKDLLTQYQQNEVRADQLYKGHYIEVYGNVRRVGKDILDNAYVAFRPESAVVEVRCNFLNPTPAWLGTVTPGMEISLVSKAAGMSTGVILSECRAGSIGFESNTLPRR